MRNALKCVMAGLALTFASVIMPVAPASATPYGPCGPVGISFNQQACVACTEAHSQDGTANAVCVGGDQSVTPPQGICNITGACGQSYRSSGYHTCPPTAPIQVGNTCTYGPAIAPKRADDTAPNQPATCTVQTWNPLNNCKPCTAESYQYHIDGSPPCEPGPGGGLIKPDDLN
jgi:hypothetical protein